jgi:transmembrane sensor
MNYPHHIFPLIEKFLSGEINAEELNILNDWYRQFDNSVIDLSSTDLQNEHQLSNRIKQRLQTEMVLNTISSSKKPLYQRLRIPAVAAIFLLLIGSFYLIMNQQKAKTAIAKVDKPAQLKNDLLPGTPKALLVLDDGTTIELDNLKNGVINQQGNTAIQKTNQGSLKYVLDSKLASNKVHYNSISTPRGGEYFITLADGTKVWLNAASSIHFPTSFEGKNRIVEITGEVYFEVTKNPHQPFIVKTDKSEIEVLGTHFNINAYEDESFTRASLLEGSIKVSSVNKEKNLTSVKYIVPGTQAKISKNGNLEIVKDIDTEAVVAWKNSLFVFKSDDIKTIMRQLSRWYDVDVEYNGNVNMRFTGQITRNINVKKVFEKLQLTGEVNFKIANNTIIVSKSK